MDNYDGFEKDWKLYRKKIGEWQEDYMGRLCEEYMAVLNSDSYASEKFWELHDRIQNDRNKVGVITKNARSLMIRNICSLIKEGAITLENLDEFSDELKLRVEIFTR